MSEPNRDLEQLDLTERAPPSFDRDELGLDAPADGESKPRATPPPIPAAARTSRSMRAASVPPPIPDAARTSRPMRAASVPPPIPQRALTQSGRTLVPKTEEAVDVDLTSFAPTEAPPSDQALERDPAPLDIAPRGTAPIPATRDAAVIDVPSLALADDWSISGTVEPASDWSLGNNAEPASLAAAASTTELASDAATDGAESPAEEEAPAVAPPLPTFMLSAARTSLPTPPPLARDARRGTLPPPIRSSTSSFVVAPAPTPPATSSVLPAVSAFPVVVEAKAPARHEDPTPLPRPHVEHTDEIWFDSMASTDSREADADELLWDSTSNLHRKVAPIPVFKLGIAAVLVGGLSAMTVILLRGDHDAPARRTHHAAIAQEQTLAPTPAPVVTPAAPAVAPAAPAVAPVATPEQAGPAAVIPEPAPAATTPEPAPVANAPAAEPQVAAAEPPPASPTTRELPFTTEPEGATVTLITNGATSVVGVTPLNVNIDPALTYDIVLTRPGYRTRLARIDPKADEVHVVLVSNDEPAPARAKATHEEREERAETSTPAPPTRVNRTEAVASTPAPTERAKRPEQRPSLAAPRPTRVAAETPKGGTGILMVSSKPPCEIAVDGVATMLMTPQRAIKLKPGKHKVTLFNTARKIDKTFDVAILPGQPTKLIRDFMVH
ncbi:MAG TPA: PEGA domain-containing protein [Kofleriaceae bacterium]|nr:PEGA domain-containing protein [Kofleriaceae bacterium]